MGAGEPPAIFISYARSSEAHARRIAQALRAGGHSVWWDEDLPAHRPYGDVIEERLNASKAVLVLWSAAAARSHWVRAEADAARNAGTLVQVSLDGAMPPMPFNQIQCPNLSDWSGEGGHPAWRKIQDSICELVEGTSAATHRAALAAAPAARRLSICVLPFANVSGDAEQDYFSDGISEDLIIGLSKVPGLAVIARNTSFTFKGRAAEVTAVGRQLNVSHVLEGSVRKAGNRLRITTQLVDAISGHQLWAERYDRELTDVFEVQDEISEAIVAGLSLKLGPREAQAEQNPPPPRAYVSYLQARHCWSRGTEAALHQAVSLFRRAIADHPTYGRSYAGLADAFVQLGMHTYLAPSAAYAEARSSAQRALTLDPELADAHASLGLIAFVHDWDAQSAEQHLAKAVELDPSSVSARHHYSRLLSALGRHAEAIAQAQAAVDLDPLSVVAAVRLPSAVAMAGDAHSSVERLEELRSIFPDEFRIYYNLTFALGSAGRGDEAVAAAEQAVRVGGRDMFSLGALGFAFALAGRPGEAHSILAEMEAAAADRYVCPFDIAVIYATLKDSDAALRWLGRAVEMRDHAMLFAAVDPALNCLKGDPRLERILERVWNR